VGVLRVIAIRNFWKAELRIHVTIEIKLPATWQCIRLGFHNSLETFSNFQQSGKP
jgi:hypothetical protein